jgi:hypothetical protein
MTTGCYGYPGTRSQASRPRLPISSTDLITALALNHGHWRLCHVSKSRTHDGIHVDRAKIPRVDRDHSPGEVQGLPLSAPNLGTQLSDDGCIKVARMAGRCSLDVPSSKDILWRGTEDLQRDERPPLGQSGESRIRDLSAECAFYHARPTSLQLAAQHVEDEGIGGSAESLGPGAVADPERLVQSLLDLILGDQGQRETSC